MTMKASLKPIIVLTVSWMICLLSSSCKTYRGIPGPGGYIIGSGVVVEQTRDLASFHGIKIKCSGEVVFSKGGPQMLRIVVDDNIIDHIRTVVENDGTLTIESDVEFSSGGGLKVYATMEETIEFSIEGSAKIKSESPFTTNALVIAVAGSGEIDMDVEATSIVSSIEGSGSISLSGKAFNHIFSIAGDGSLNALNLEVDTYIISIAGAGICRIHVTHQLELTIVGAGIVYYTGDPSVLITSITGGGSLIKI